MRMKNSLLAVSAMLAMAAGITAPDIPRAAGPQPTLEMRKRLRFLGGYQPIERRRATRGPGWTFAHVKRMARKKRNQARNRRAHR